MLIKTKYIDQEVVLHWTHYANGQNALLLYALNGEPLARASVSIADREQNESEIYIKTWSENKGLLEALTAAGVLFDTRQVVQCGYASAAICKIVNRS